MKSESLILFLEKQRRKGGATFFNKSAEKTYSSGSE